MANGEAGDHGEKKDRHDDGGISAWIVPGSSSSAWRPIPAASAFPVEARVGASPYRPASMV